MLTRRSLLAASAATAAAPLVPAFADTPKDVLVIGMRIDDIISLDPAEAFEFSGGEMVVNCYNRLVVPNPANPNTLKGDLAERWEIGPDGQTFTFFLRPDAKFASGKPVTAEDAAFSLQRAIKLNKAPAFIINQFGFTRDNVDSRIVAKDGRTLVVTVGEKVAPTLVLYCLTANVGCVVERAVALANAQNDDFGNQWLKTNSAGSGSFAVRSWRASESVILDPNAHALDRAKPRRVIVKHIPDPSAQLLQLQKGDIDIARDLQSDQLRTVQNDQGVRMSSAARSYVLYLAMNQKHPELAKPQVRQAIKWAIDYDGIQKNITPFTWQVHQSFLPKGFPAEIPDRPFQKDPARARKLLAEAGVPNGFEITMDHRSGQPEADIAQALQANLGEIGIKVTLLAGESRQVITKTRARQHQLAQLSWGADYFDPHTNAETFNVNADNGDGARNRTLAWRSAWQDADLTERAMAASRETDPEARVTMYEQMQRDHQQRSPFAIMLQSSEFAVLRKNVSGFEVAPLSDRHRVLPGDEIVVSSRMRALAGTFASVPITLFGLVLVTFLIGRVMPIDPVLAIVGDRAPQDVVERTRAELGLDQSLPVQLWIYIGKLLQGDLGRSVMTSHTVVDDIARFFPATMELATVAILLAMLIGVPLGVLAAVKQGTAIDHTIRVVCLAGHSLPIFVLALLALLVFYATLGIAPGPGRQDVVFEGMVPVVTNFLTIDALLAGDWEAFHDALAHLVLPASVLAYFSMAYIARMTRAFMLDALSGEFVVTARAKGLSSARVIWRHAFGNIAVRLITVLALTYAGLLEGAVVTETVFSWPGLGQYLTVSLLNADMNAVLGATLVVGLTYLAFNLLADMLYRLLDPRVDEGVR